jgi:hypothetical protein
MDDDPKQNIEIRTKFKIIFIDFKYGPLILS